MTGTMFFNMLLNIGLLVLLATLLTNMASVRKLFRGESSTIIQKMALAVIFGAISIVSTYTGTKTGGAIVNTRVIGVLTAGIMGGPFVGMMTALIAGAHRFLFDIGGFTAASCAVSTLVEGVLGSQSVIKTYKVGRIRTGISGIYRLSVQGTSLFQPLPGITHVNSLYEISGK